MFHRLNHSVPALRAHRPCPHSSCSVAPIFHLSDLTPCRIAVMQHREATTCSNHTIAAPPYHLVKSVSSRFIMLRFANTAPSPSSPNSQVLAAVEKGEE
ncbi:unnamed protein product [Ilex paraguariensis]|uniref:Uncharacterized protein n=1 Tax=Ilex paraguariensis TaxID=185542 RepID=A0ABC8TN43_9AQUA